MGRTEGTVITAGPQHGAAPMDPTTLAYVASATEDLQNNLRIRQNDDTDDSGQEKSSTLAAGADSVTISEEGKRLSGQAVQKIEDNEESETSQTTTEMRIERLEERIKKIQQELEEAQSDNELSDKEKQTKVQALTAELLQIQQELAELQSQSGTTGGGTSAEGFANSLT